MKKNIAIVAFLVCAFSFTSHAQVQDTVLLADETFLNYTKTEAKITCDNESVFNDIFKTHGLLFKRFTCTWKTDRHGRYKHYVVYLTKEDAELIKSWASKNL